MVTGTEAMVPHRPVHDGPVVRDTVDGATAGVLADVVALAHAGFLGFLVVGGFLSWRWPRLLPAHVATAAWAAAIVTVRFDCPLTPLEKNLREAAGEPVYAGPFIDHYLRDRVFPGDHEPVVRAAVVGAVAVSWAGALGLRRRRVHRRSGRQVVRSVRP